MSAAEEYARQARLAAEESKASAARSAAHAQASAEATASMIIGSASSAATSAEASATAAATAASQAIAARDLAEASGERARQAADGAERSQADVAHSVELIRGMTIGLKLPACTNKGIMPSEEGVYVSWKDPEDLMLGDSPVAEWARTELWRLEIPNDADIAYPTWPLGDDGAVLVAVSTPGAAGTPSCGRRSWTRGRGRTAATATAWSATRPTAGRPCATRTACPSP